MAWGEKYKCEFADTLGLVWTTKIYEDGYAGTVTELIATGQPLTFNFIGNSDDIYDPIIETEVKIRVWSATNFALDNLYSSENMHFKVIITTPYGGGDVQHFIGYVDCGNYEEPYEDVPYEVTITACSGLKFLKEIKYDDNGTPYNGLLLQSKIILDILGKIGFTTFTEFINIYEESMAIGVSDSPFDQIRIDVDLFQDLYCYDVLAEIVKIYGAVIRQIESNYVIYRPVELKSSTVYGRYFQGETNKTGTSLSPQRYINRSTNPSNLIQVPGGVIMIINPAKKITIVQDYGNKESWIDNFKFTAESWNGTNFEHWTDSIYGVVKNFIGDLVPGEKEGVAIQWEYPSTSKYIEQYFGSFAKSSIDDVIIIEFDYLFYNVKGSDVATVYSLVQIESDDGDFLHCGLNDLEEATWASDPDPYINITGASPVGTPVWQHFSRKVVGLPSSGYTIRLLGAINQPADEVWVCYKNIRFYATSTKVYQKQVRRKFLQRIRMSGGYGGEYQIDLKPKYRTVSFTEITENIVEYRHVVENVIIGSELLIDMMLGDVPEALTTGTDADTDLDNVIEQFAGSLTSNIRTLLQVVHTVTLTSTSGDGDISITCDGLKRTITYFTSLSATATLFRQLYEADYDALGINLTNSGADIIFTGTAGQDFNGDTTVTEQTGGLDGTVVETQPDSYSDVITSTTDWNTRGGIESKILLAIIADEMAAQYARPKQLIQMALRDQNPDLAEILTYILGCYEDDLNKYSANNRKFVVGRGSFEVKERFVMIDLKEVI